MIFIFIFKNTALRFVSCCFRSTHQMSTEGFDCLLKYLLESGGKFEFEIGLNWKVFEVFFFKFI